MRYAACSAKNLTSSKIKVLVADSADVIVYHIIQGQIAEIDHTALDEKDNKTILTFPVHERGYYIVKGHKTVQVYKQGTVPYVGFVISSSDLELDYQILDADMQEKDLAVLTLLQDGIIQISPNGLRSFFVLVNEKMYFFCPSCEIKKETSASCPKASLSIKNTGFSISSSGSKLAVSSEKSSKTTLSVKRMQIKEL